MDASSNIHTFLFLLCSGIKVDSEPLENLSCGKTHCIG